MKNEIVTIELFADDLTEAGIQKFKDKEVWNDNWDIMPIVVMDFEVETPLVKRILCPFCKESVVINSFKSKNYLDEWLISGLCEKCQDEVFKPFEADAIITIYTGEAPSTADAVTENPLLEIPLCQLETPLVKKHQGATRDNNLCPFCKDPVLASLFTNRRALDEWTISGLCAKCQDEVFGKEI